MKLDTKRMHYDILRRLNAIEKPQRYLGDKLGISRATFWRLSQGNDITVDTFFKLVKWLDVDVNRYIKR